MTSFLTAVNCLSFIINSLLHTSKAAALWVMIMQVFLFSFLMLSSTFSSVFLSSADVASSRRIIGALLINALAIAKSVFDALGAETYVINNEPNGTNINMEAGSTHIEVLQKYVKDNKLDIGFAYDGDADRCLCIDDKGNIVDGDLILYVCGVYMKQNGELDNNTVVTTIMSNIGLYKAFDAVGIDYAKTDVGDKYVYECMRNNNFRLGGEQSGHIIFSKYATTGDGILTSIKLMEVMLSTKKKMSELISPVVIYPPCLMNIWVESKPEARADVDVQAEVEKVAKLLGDDGRILVRESGTEPVIRVMVEAKTDHLAEKYVNQVIKVIEDKGHAV